MTVPCCFCFSQLIFSDFDDSLGELREQLDEVLEKIQKQENVKIILIV